MNVLVTGAGGFVGKRLCEHLEKLQWQVRQAHRCQHVAKSLHFQPERMQIGEIGRATDWQLAVSGIDWVVHLAARVHVMNDQGSDSLSEFRHVNVEGTANLARQAADAGVKRFIYLSSIKVNGEFTEPGRTFSASDVPAPLDPYGISKLEAENELRQISRQTGMEVVIIRSPLVYGPGVKANFESMMRWLASGVPLPLAAVTNNRRSLVALDNLVDLIVTCLNHPAAANQTFLVSDGEDLSTAQLLKRMGAAMGHPARLFYLPPALLKLGAAVLNKPGIYQRLCGSLQLDITKTRQLLGWTPPVSVDEGLRRAAASFRQ
jgi:nucleoside-diphosphate-sugar epimerase